MQQLLQRSSGPHVENGLVKQDRRRRRSVPRRPDDLHPTFPRQHALPFESRFVRIPNFIKEGRPHVEQRRRIQTVPSKINVYASAKNEDLSAGGSIDSLDREIDRKIIELRGMSQAPLQVTTEKNHVAKGLNKDGRAGSTSNSMMHPELRKFLIESNANNASSDMLVINDGVNETSVHPYELLRLNGSSASAAHYNGTVVKSLGKFWMLPPGFRTSRRRRSVVPYYAVSSFAMNPTYVRSKNQTLYTVFLRVSDSALQKYVSNNGRASSLQDDDSGHVYSEELFNFVTNRANRKNEVMKNLQGHGWEELFHKLYEQMKKDDEKRHGTLEPIGYHVTYAVLHNERGMRSGNILAKENKKQAAKASMRKRQDLHHHIGEKSTRERDNVTTRGAKTRPSTITRPSTTTATPSTSNDEVLLENMRKLQQNSTTPEDINNVILPEIVQKLAELGYEVKKMSPDHDKPSQSSVTEEIDAGPSISLVQTTAITPATLSAIMIRRDQLSQEADAPSRKNASNADDLDEDNEEDKTGHLEELLSQNAFGNQKLSYRPLNGKRMSPSFLGSLQPEALVAPNPAGLPRDVQDYPLAVVFRRPKPAAR